MTTLYRYYDERDRLLYVGVTDSASSRQRAHSTARWWPLVERSTFTHYESRDEALAAETRAIVDESPVFNVAGRPGVSDWVDALQVLAPEDRPYAPSRRAERQASARIGALTSWANTPDRAERTAPARRKSPGDLGYWIDRLDPEKFAGATDTQREQAADAMRRAHFARLALKSAKARSAKRQPR